MKWFGFRACLKTQRGPAAREFGGGKGGEAGASPKRAATAESTRATGKRPAARRVFSETAHCLRCSSLTDPSGYAPSSRLAIEPFLRKQGPSEFSDRLSASTGTSGDPDFRAVVDPNQQVTSTSARLWQAFAGNPDVFAASNSSRDGHPQGTVEPADGFGTALGRPIGGDLQGASNVGASNLESGIRTGFDSDRDRATAKIAFAGNAKPSTGCRSGGDLQGVGLGPFRIGGVLDPDIQSGASQKVVEPQVDVLGQVFLDPGGADWLSGGIGLVQLLIVDFPSIRITEDLMCCVEGLGLFNGIRRTSVEVRVVLFGEQSVGDPDLLGRAAAVEAQSCVVVWKGCLQRSVLW